MMRSAHSWFVKFVAFSVLPMAIVAAFNSIVDPFQLFRPSGAFIIDREHQRLANAGLIRTAQDVANVVVGSSFVGNLDTDLLTELFGGRSLLLSIAAGGNRDMLLTTAYALRLLPAVKNAFIEVAGGPCDKDVQHVVYFPVGVYLNQPFATLSELLLMETTRLSVLKLRMTYAGQYAYPFSNQIRDMDNWYHLMPERFNNPELVRQQFHDVGIPVASITKQQIENAASNWTDCFKREYLAFAEKYPQTQFYFFSPPKFQWQQWASARQGYLEVLTRAEEIVATSVSQLPNAKYFDFNAVTSLTNDCRRFMDMFHFDPAAMDDMVRWMHEGTYQVTPENSGATSRIINGNARERVPCPPIAEQ